MPVVGTAEWRRGDSGMSPGERLVPEPVTLERVEILQLFFEVTRAGYLERIPSRLHPSLPATMVVTAYRAASGPFGAFTMVESRIGTRLGDKARNLLTRAYAEPRPAATSWQALGVAAASGWIQFARSYDTIHLEVRSGQRVVGAFELRDPLAVPAAPVVYTGHLNPVELGRGPRLLELEPAGIFEDKERGRPVVRTFDPSGWGLGEVSITGGIGAMYAVGTVTFPAPALVHDPSGAPDAPSEPIG